MTRALRALRARPGFTLVTVATLALGFGVNAAVFSLTRTVLLRALPYRDADRLVQLNEANAARNIDSTGLAPTTSLFGTSRAFWIPRARSGMVTVVGVVRDVREDGLLDSAGFPQLYLPYAQNPTVVVTIMPGHEARRRRRLRSARRSAASIRSCRFRTNTRSTSWSGRRSRGHASWPG